MSVYSIEDIKIKLSPIFATYHIKKAVLFGSCAKGTAEKGSDVDIIIDDGGNLPGLSFYGLVDSVATELKIPVDIIDFIDIIPDSKVDTEIKRTGVVIYES